MKFTSSTGRTDHMHVATSEFAAIKHWLREYKDHYFPVGSVVVVNRTNSRVLIGIVFSFENCPPDHLAVMGESGNIWFYHLNTIAFRETRVKRWPSWVRAFVLRNKLQVQRDRHSSEDREADHHD